MENKNRTSIRKFIEWVIGNTVWEYFRFGFSIIFSFISTWGVYVYSTALQWLFNMNIPLFIIIIVIIVTFIGFLTIVWFLLSLLFQFYQWVKSKISNKDEAVKLFCKIIKDGNEVFIEVKNTEWFIDIRRVSFLCHFLYKSNTVLDPLEWIENSNKNGSVFIPRRKTKTIHFATIKPLDKVYMVHLLERDLEFSFANDRILEFSIEGLSSAPITMNQKRNIRGRLLILESVTKGAVNFEISYQVY